MKSIAIVDTSWMMYKNKFSLRMLSVDLQQPSGLTLTIPTGHIYGTIQDIATLSSNYDLVIMAVDSPVPFRKEILSNYKADRHTKTGDSFQDYNIYNDLYNILALCTRFSNVYYLKVPLMESDDIIASWIASTVSSSASGTPNLERFHLSCYMNDNDILQTPGEYSWYNNLSSKEIDRLEYLSNKYGSGEDNSWKYSHLPEVIKLIRGDSSDKIPPALPRFSTQSLLNLCNVPEFSALVDIDALISFLSDEATGKSSLLGLSSAWKAKLSVISSPDNLYNKALRTNYTVVHPIIKPLSEFTYKKISKEDFPDEEIAKVVNRYKLASYYDILHDLN